MYLSLFRFFQVSFGLVIISAIALCNSTLFNSGIFLGSFLPIFFICFPLYCFVQVRWFCWSRWSTQFCLLLIFKQFVMLLLSPPFLLCLSLCLNRFLNLSRIWRCLWGGGYLESLFQLFLYGSMQHKVYLDFVVWWSSCQDQQSNVWIGHFHQNQPQSPGTYGWLLPRQEQEDSMSHYSMIAFGCNF